MSGRHSAKATHIIMALAKLGVLLLAVSGSWSFAKSSQPVYGFNGAISALGQGELLHYDINLPSCHLTHPIADQPEFMDRFGGFVNYYRTINEQKPVPRTNIVFYLQKPVHNITGGLVQLSREITIWPNNSARVASLVFSADFSSLIQHYEHDCTMESTNQTLLADVYLKAIGSPSHLFNFYNLSQALEQGSTVTFSAMTFLCGGGDEYSYSTIGGHITSYDVSKENGSTLIESTVASTVRFQQTNSAPMVDVLTIRVRDNRAVQFQVSTGKPPHMDHLTEHVLDCYLETGMPGGTVNLFSL